MRKFALRFLIACIFCGTFAAHDATHAADARISASQNQSAARQTSVAQSVAQSDAPLTNPEFLRLVRRLPAEPALRDEIVAEVRRRGISFPLTAGLRSVVATKSGNDVLLRRTLEEAERRRAGVADTTTDGARANAYTLPPAAEAADLLERARVIALNYKRNMPDFVVRQQIARSYAHGSTRNWIPQDRLTVAVAYRESAGEQYKLLAVNGFPVPQEQGERSSYEQDRGTTSTGEFVSMIVGMFDPTSKTEFRAVDTDTLPKARTIVYEYEVKLENSKQAIKYGGAAESQAITVGYRGRVWVDRETARVWTIDFIATDIPETFPVRAATNRIDYDWTRIDEKDYMLPTRASVELTSRAGVQAGRERLIQTRNVIRFRDYQKFGAKVEIIEDDIEAPEAEGEEPAPPQ